jgi:hypothetical protein
LLSLLVTGVAPVAQESAAEIEWPRKQYDPSPGAEATLGNELVLPMPCGGAMAFLRVATDGAGWLGERAVELGSRELFDAPLDQLRATHVAGAFNSRESGEAGGSYYLLGKYEVTQLQLRVIDEPCPDRLRGRQPAVAVSWYDAMAFTQRYTEWLYANARDKLPSADGLPGFLRLPTEVEWEYAARGGRQVDAKAFQQRLFPLGAHALEAHAWFRESVSPTFRTRPIGLLQPNPLGLHDMLGNAAELIFDLFQLSAGGRLHAQPGGFTVKGGHFRSPRKGLATSMRQEHPHFNADTGTQTRLDTVGFRVAISAPVLTSVQRVQVIQKEWAKWPRAATSGRDLRCDDATPAVTPGAVPARQQLERCEVVMGRRPLPDFPEFARAAPVTAIPTWTQLRDKLHDLSAEEIHRYALVFFDARDPDTALLLFREAARKGDGRSALAVGAMYDPKLFESGTAGRTPFSKANRELARCWYQVAWTLGEVRAWARVKGLAARDAETPPPADPDLSVTPPGCEQLLQQYGSQ